MKKTLILLIMFAAAGLAFASDVTIGFTGGYNIAWFSGGDWDTLVDTYYDSNDARGGIALGVFFDFGLTDFFSLQPEIIFMSSGGRASTQGLYDSDGDRFDDELTETISLFTFPLSAKFKIKAGRGDITLFGGPMLSLMVGDLKEKYKMTYDYYGSYSSKSEIKVDNHLLYGYQLGTGYEFPLGIGKIITNLKYSQLLNYFFDDDKTKINNFTINLGYGFKVK